MKRLEPEHIIIENDKITTKPPSILGGWVTFLLLYLLILAASYLVIGAVDPFQVSSQQDIDTFGKTPMAFRMAWNISRSQCSFTNCTEFVRVTNSDSMTVLNFTANNSSAWSRTLQLNIATELYSDQNDYSVQMDQCCTSLQVRPIPMLRISDPTEAGMNFVPAFEMFNGTYSQLMKRCYGSTDNNTSFNKITKKLRS